MDDLIYSQDAINAIERKIETMNWDEFLNQNIENNYNGQILTDIDCPKCGRKIYYDSTIILTSYPSKFRYWCSCGWEGTAHERWFRQCEGNNV